MTLEEDSLSTKELARRHSLFAQPTEDLPVQREEMKKRLHDFQQRLRFIAKRRSFILESTEEERERHSFFRKVTVEMSQTQRLFSMPTKESLTAL